MRSLKRVFDKIKGEHPYWSDYICFSHAISRKGFSKKTISRHFNRLVDKDNYQKGEKNEILEWLFRFSQETKKQAEESRFQG